MYVKVKTTESVFMETLSIEIEESKMKKEEDVDHPLSLIKIEPVELSQCSSK